MTIATGARHKTRYIQEVTYGTTPATPAWSVLPHDANSLGLTKDGLEQTKARSDRQVAGRRHGNRQVGGSVGGQLEFGSFDDMLEAVTMGTWTADVLSAANGEGFTTRRSFTFERVFELDTDEYRRYLGCEINSMSMSVAPNSLITVEFGVIGQDIDGTLTEVVGSTENAILNNDAFDSFTGTIQEGATLAPISIVSQIDLSIENGLETAFVIGSPTTIRPSDGKSRVTGTLTAFFEDSSLYDKFINETQTALQFVLVDPAGNQLQFDMPNVKFNGGNPDMSGDGRISTALEFTADYDATAQSNLIITRTSI